MPTPEQLKLQQDSLAALLSSQAPSGQYGRTSDLLAQDTDQYGRFDPRGGSRYTAETNAALESDPWTQHYEDVGEMQSQEQMYDRPGQFQQREDALMQRLAPIREQGRFDLEKQRIASGGAVQAAEAQAASQRQGREASMQRTQVGQAGQVQRQRNTMLEAQAKAAQGTSRNPLQWLMGAPSGEERAATLRGQQQFDQQPQGGESPDMLAQDLYAEFASASPEQVAAYAQQELGLSDPAEVAGLVAAYQALQGQ